MAGIYAGDAEQMSVQATFPRFVELEQQYGSVIRGMMSAREVPHRLRTGQHERCSSVCDMGFGDLVTALVALTDKAWRFAWAAGSTPYVCDLISSVVGCMT